jgi:hypothetical protein
MLTVTSALIGCHHFTIHNIRRRCQVLDIQAILHLDRGLTENLICHSALHPVYLSLTYESSYSAI